MKVFQKLRFLLICVAFFLVGYYVQKINLVPKIALAVQGTLNLGSTINSVTIMKSKTSYLDDMIFGGGAGGTSGVLSGTTGNIGIGVGANTTTSYLPSARLEINGGEQIKLTNGSNITRIFDDGNMNILRTGTGSLNVGSVASPWTTVSLMGNVGVGTTGPINKLDVAGDIGLKGGSNFRLYNSANNGWVTIRFDDTNVNANYPWHFTGTQVAFDGNVGIGSTTPGQKLSVAGVIESTTGGFKYPDGTTQTSAVAPISGTTNYVTKYTSTTTLGNSRIFDNGTNVGIGTTSPADIFDVNGKFTVTSGGNVGVGSTVPAAKVDIAGTNSVISNTAGNMTLMPAVNLLVSQGNVGIGSAIPAAKLDIAGVTSTIANNAGNMNLVPAANLIVSQGNVGVGTSNPTAKFEVGGVTSTISNVSGNLSLVPASNLVVSQGNVGIGSASPGFKLDVNGIINATALYVGGSPYIGSQWTTSGTRIYYNTGNVGIGTTAPAGVLDVIGKLTVLPSGNVGIGTTNPTGLFQVKGSASTFAATGGTITQSGAYTIHTFTTSGTFTPNGSGNVEVLVVGGGGGGGGDPTAGAGMGGGGAGGLIYNSSYPVTSQAITVTVGAGGAGGTNTGYNLGSNGNDSVFSTLTAVGGGRGGGYNAQAGGNGGSGGGGGCSTGAVGAPGSGTSGQGNSGGTALAGNPWISGGGGGAGAAGSPATSGSGGNGGNGLAYSISGTQTYYAGGGGAGSYNVGVGTGGLGGGGNGALGNGQNGTANTGGGGGGAGTNISNSGTGGNGGSGIVIIRYLTPGVSDALFVNATSGNVGIGTTAPAKKVEVIGSVQASCPTGQVAIGGSCIDSTARAAGSFQSAVNVCFAENKRICTFDEYMYACQNSLVTGSGTWEHTAVLAYVMWSTTYYQNVDYLANMTCPSGFALTWDYYSTARPYRCCSTRNLGGQ